MNKQTNSADVDSAGAKKGFLEGSTLRIRENAPLWPANLAAEILTRELAAKPWQFRELLDGGLLPKSSTCSIQPNDVIYMRRKFSAVTGVSQRATLRCKHVEIID